MSRKIDSNKAEASINTLVLMVSTACNLFCRYCYANGGNYNRASALMKEDVALSALDKIVDLCPTIDTIKIFGGEPLLNYPVIKAVCAYVEERLDKTVLFGMSTNGTILNDEIIDMFHRYRFALSISLDGNESITDRLRVDKQNKGHFQRIIHNMERLRKENIPFAIEATYTGLHMREGVTILQLVKYLGQYATTIKVQPVYMCKYQDMAILDLPRFKDCIEEYAQGVLDALCSPDYFEDDYLYENFVVRCIMNLLAGAASNKWICQLNRNITVFPDGDVFPCYLFTKEYMGNILKDFPSVLAANVKRRVDKITLQQQIQHRCKNNLWYSGLVGDICLGELAHPHYNLGRQLSLSPHIDLFYDTLCRTVIAEVLRIREDPDKLPIFNKNISQLSDNTEKWLGIANVNE